MNRTTIKIGQQSKPEIRQQLIGIVAHQCHETFDIAAQPAPDDHVGAYAEIVRQFGRPATPCAALLAWLVRLDQRASRAGCDAPFTPDLDHRRMATALRTLT